MQLTKYSFVVTRSVLAKTGLHSQQSSEGGALQAPEDYNTPVRGFMRETKKIRYF
jgi:hypothetical protein